MKNEKEIIALIKKAERSLLAAKELYKKEFFDFSVSRAYYTMFYCAEALLLTKNLSFSKHSGVISFFGKEFIKTGLLPTELHNYIIDAFSRRQKGDYGALSLAKEECKNTLKRADKFLSETKKYIQNFCKIRNL